MVVFHRCSKEIQICQKNICPGDLSLLQNANGSYEHFKKIRNHKRLFLRGDIPVRREEQELLLDANKQVNDIRNAGKTKKLK